MKSHLAPVREKKKKIKRSGSKEKSIAYWASNSKIGKNQDKKSKLRFLLLFLLILFAKDQLSICLKTLILILNLKLDLIFINLAIIDQVFGLTIKLNQYKFSY